MVRSSPSLKSIHYHRYRWNESCPFILFTKRNYVRNPLLELNIYKLPRSPSSIPLSSSVKCLKQNIFRRIKVAFRAESRHLFLLLLLGHPQHLKVNSREPVDTLVTRISFPRIGKSPVAFNRSTSFRTNNRKVAVFGNEELCSPPESLVIVSAVTTMVLSRTCFNHYWLAWKVERSNFFITRKERSEPRCSTPSNTFTLSMSFFITESTENHKSRQFNIFITHVRKIKSEERNVRTFLE